MKPSNFKEYPWSSVTRKSEAETVAKNIMVILARTGDKFRPLDWAEYKAERIEDGEFTESEKPYFNQVIGYCASSETAVLFSLTWAKAANRHQAGQLLYWSDGTGCMRYEPCVACDGSGWKSGWKTRVEAAYYDEVEDEIPF